jgi:serine/threonine protein kinase
LLPQNPDEDQDDIIIGTEYYISPEMVTEKTCSYSADLWALGVMIYKMLSGELPFCGKTTD